MVPESPLLLTVVVFSDELSALHWSMESSIPEPTSMENVPIDHILGQQRGEGMNEPEVSRPAGLRAH